jgi:hypothetical protein
MYASCSHGCCRPARRERGDALSFDMSSASGQRTRGLARRIPVPKEMTQAYTDMVSRLPGLIKAPTLEFYDDLQGFGGLFISDSWVIAVGQSDMERIVETLIATRPADVDRVIRDIAAAQSAPINSVRKVLLGGAMGRCMAHELGHSLIFLGYMNPYAPDEEAGADYYAGRLDAARGRGGRLGEMFFRAIGCVGSMCHHPSPHGRVTAYSSGYYAQMQNGG